MIQSNHDRIYFFIFFGIEGFSSIKKFRKHFKYILLVKPSSMKEKLTLRQWDTEEHTQEPFHLEHAV